MSKETKIKRKEISQWFQSKSLCVTQTAPALFFYVSHFKLNKSDKGSRKSDTGTAEKIQSTLKTDDPMQTTCSASEILSAWSEAMRGTEQNCVGDTVWPSLPPLQSPSISNTNKESKEITLLPDRWCVVSVAWERLAEVKPQMDWISGPVTVTGLVFGWSRAAFRGLMELKKTADRQPVKPREAIWAKSGSNPSESIEKRQAHRLWCFIKCTVRMVITSLF